MTSRGRDRSESLGAESADGFSIDEQTHDLEAETLTGDVRDALLMQLRDMKVGWTMLPEREQRDRIQAIEAVANTLVRQVISLTMSFDFPSLGVQIGDWRMRHTKDGPMIEVRLSMAGIETNGVKLLQHGGTAAVLVLADHQAFAGERAPAAATPDQSDMLGSEAA